MTYATIAGTKRKLDDQLWDEVDIDQTIEDTFPDVVAWVNSACRRTVNFSESDLVGVDSIIRLAGDCYCSCRIMSEHLESGDITIDDKDMSLAAYRCSEARQAIEMWCANNGIIPGFSEPEPSADATTEVGSHFAYAIGSDSVCIQGG